MEWKRETEFRQLLTAQIKHLTKDGLDTLAQLATSDMAESYKAVPALAMHKAKRVDKNGPGRLHVLRILDAIIAKSRQRHSSKDKFVPRIEASKAAQAIFGAISESPPLQKAKAAKILQVWRKNNIFAPPTLAAAEDALGADAVLAEATSAATARPQKSADKADPGAESSATPASYPRPDATAAAADGGVKYTPNSGASASLGLGATQLLPPVGEPSTADAGRHGNRIDVGSRASVPRDDGRAAAPPGLPAASLPGPPPRVPLYAPSSLAGERAAREAAAAPEVLAAAPGAPPLPEEGVAPFQAGVDAVVLPSGATLNNPKGGRSKHRRSKFDQPAAPRPPGGSGLGSNGSVETLARSGSGSAGVDAAPPPPRYTPHDTAAATSGGGMPPPPATRTTASSHATPAAPGDVGTLHEPTNAAMAGGAYGFASSGSNPALMSRIRSSIATLRSDPGSMAAPLTVPPALPLPPHTTAAPGLPHGFNTPSAGLAPVSRRSGAESLPLPPVPTAASVPGIPGLLPKAQAPPSTPSPALPPPPAGAAAPRQPGGGGGERPAAIGGTPQPPWVPALTEPAPPGLLEVMPPVPSLTGPASIEVKPPPSFGEVWVPSADTVQPANPPPLQQATPPLPTSAAAPAPVSEGGAVPPWGPHAWGTTESPHGGAGGTGSMAAPPSAPAPPAPILPPSKAPPDLHHQQGAGAVSAPWASGQHDMHAGHVQQPPGRPAAPPQLRPPPSAAPPRHRFSAPPLGLPFPGVPSGGPPQAPPLAPPFSRPFPPSHKPPSSSPAYNPFAASSQQGPQPPQRPPPAPGGQPPPLAPPPPPRNSHGAWSPHDAPAAAAMPPPPPMQAPHSGPRPHAQAYDPAAAAAEAPRRTPPAAPEEVPSHSHGLTGTYPGSPELPRPPAHAQPAPGPPGTVAVNGAATADADAAAAHGSPPTAEDGTGDGPPRKRRRSRWDENAGAPEAAE